MQNYNINYYNSIDNISENSQHIMEEIILTPWNALNDAQQNYVVNQLKKCGMYSVYENVRISKTTDALKSMDSALYYIFRENDKFVKIAMEQPEGFYFSDEKTAEKILQRIFEHPQFDKSLWTSRKYRKASQILNDITRMPDCSIKYYQENKESFEKRKRQSLLARETALSLNLKRKLKLYFTNPNIVNTRDYEIFESRKYPSSFIIT